MVQAQAFPPSERLPWLPDEPARRRPPSRRVQAIAAVAAILIGLAGGSYWLGVNLGPDAQHARPAKAPAPQPRTGQPQQPEVALQPQPEVSLAPQRELTLAAPRSARRSEVGPNRAQPQSGPADSGQATGASEAQPTDESAATTAAPALALTPPVTLTPWPASKSVGASGRIVRIGAFGSRQQAKLGWRYMVRAYPAVARLKATVVGERNSRGRHFYRFQIGTTSQAHSEVLCQRMDRIRFSCAVVGLPWKPRGVER